MMHGAGCSPTSAVMLTLISNTRCGLEWITVFNPLDRPLPRVRDDGGS